MRMIDRREIDRMRQPMWANWFGLSTLYIVFYPRARCIRLRRQSVNTIEQRAKRSTQNKLSDLLGIHRLSIALYRSIVPPPSRSIPSSGAAAADGNKILNKSKNSPPREGRRGLIDFSIADGTSCYRCTCRAFFFSIALVDHADVIVSRRFINADVPFIKSYGETDLPHLWPWSIHSVGQLFSVPVEIEAPRRSSRVLTSIKVPAPKRAPRMAK